MNLDVRHTPSQAGTNGGAAIQVGDELMAPPAVSAKILQKLKRAAEKYLGEEVTEAVITVPAYFNDSQRQATRDAGKIAGLEVKRIVNEPTAAALAYGLDKKSDELIRFTTSAVVPSISQFSKSAKTLSRWSPMNGDTHLGGDDFDDVIIDYLIDEFKKERVGSMSARTEWYFNG